MSASDPQSFFEQERTKLAEEISKSFESLLDSTNALNRKLEQVTVPSIQKEFRSIADLWMSFQGLMDPATDPTASQSGTHPAGPHQIRTENGGMPGTGGYVLPPQDGAR